MEYSYNAPIRWKRPTLQHPNETLYEKLIDQLETQICVGSLYGVAQFPCASLNFAVTIMPKKNYTSRSPISVANSKYLLLFTK